MTRPLDIALRWEPMEGMDGNCGDRSILVEEEESCLLCLIDALGHGVKAHCVADVAEKFILSSPDQKPTDMLNELHTHMRGSRGLVIGICRVFPLEKSIIFTGIGNITARIYGDATVSLLSRDGVVGYNMPAPRCQKAFFVPGDILVLSSDGLQEHISFPDHPDFLKGASRDIADYMFTHFRKKDDASCIVVRYRDD